MSVPPGSVAANHASGRHIRPMSDVSDIGHSEEFAPQLVATGWRPFVSKDASIIRPLQTAGIDSSGRWLMGEVRTASSASPAPAGVQGVPLSSSLRWVHNARPLGPRFRGEGG
jgi:hypothetical protein